MLENVFKGAQIDNLELFSNQIKQKLWRYIKKQLWLATLKMVCIWAKSAKYRDKHENIRKQRKIDVYNSFNNNSPTYWDW